MSGVQRYATEILTGLDQLLVEDSDLLRRIGPVVAFHPAGKARIPEWRHIQTRLLPGRGGHFWEQTTLLKATRESVLVSLGNSGPIRHPKHLLALHDANVWSIPGAYSKRYRMLHKTIRPMLAHKAAGLVTVSRYSARELSRHLRIAADRFVVIPNGADHILRVTRDTGTLERFGLAAGGYLLSVGNQSPNKNIARLIEAHRMAGSEAKPLVIAGGVASGVAGEVLNSGDRVKLLGRVSDETLRSLYEQAAGFVFPSLYEGFGIPPLEAMLLGTPVLAARRAALPEVLQDAPFWFDPLDISDMAAALLRFSRMSGTERTSRIELGRKVAGQFRWTMNARLLADEIVGQTCQAAPHALGAQPIDRDQPRKSA